MKRVITFLLAMFILCATAIPVFAATGSIEIHPSADGEGVSGKSFEVYRIFDATVRDDGTIRYDWYIPDGETVSPYFDFFFGTHGKVGTNPDGTIYQALSYVKTYTANSQALTLFAAELHTYIEEQSIAPSASATADTADETMAFDSLPYGYYLVYESTATGTAGVRAAVALTSVTPEGVIRLKADKPTINKTVLGVKAVSATVGDAISYEVTSDVPNTLGYTDYLFKICDTLPAALFLDTDSIIVKRNDTVLTPAEFVLDTGDNAFTVTLTEIQTYTPGDKISVTYNALVTGEAKSDAHNVNTAQLIYSNDPTDATSTGCVQSSADVHTFYLKLSNEDHDTGEALKGGKFRLYKVENDQSVALHLTPDSAAGTYHIDTVNPMMRAMPNDLEMSTNDNGVLVIEGLGAGDYQIQQTAAAEGFNFPARAISFSVTDSFSSVTNELESIDIVNVDNNLNVYGALKNAAGHISLTQNGPQGYVTFTLTNTTSFVLPDTGGIGTAIFTVLGVAIMGTAALLLLRKKKTN